MATKRYTIQDIAREAEVGVGTVSRVLNDDPNVKSNTRSKVQKVIDKIGYQPSYAARSLRTQKSNTIGFIADAVATTPFAVNLIKGAQDAAWQRGKLLLIVDADNNLDRRERAVESMLERDVEGIVYAAMYHQEVSLSDAFKSVPTVLVDCYSQDETYPSCVPDEFQGAHNAVKEFTCKNHRRIAIILGAELDSIYPAMRGRYEGYCAALKEANIALRADFVRVGEGNAHSGFAETLILMKLPEPPTAIFCCTDRMALGTYDALKSVGLNVPDDVSVIGFDNQPVIVEQLHPPLSTMALPHEEMGHWSINTLLNLSETAPQRQVLPCPFIERASVKRLEV